ncbi:hypothetical protein ACTHGU_07135 [Chitinophagaceae bacterium MMS25-I14]
MKFLVITRPNGANHGLNASSETARSMSEELRKLQDAKVIEVCYAFIGGGSAYVINADTAKQLAVLVRSNPLFHSQTHEIIPVADAYDFLEVHAQYMN